MINVGGRKVNPSEVERVLRLSPRVREAVVLGMPGSARGQEVAACVAGEATEDELRKLCSRNLPSWQVPRRWFFWKKFRSTRGERSAGRIFERDWNDLNATARTTGQNALDRRPCRYEHFAEGQVRSLERTPDSLLLSQPGKLPASRDRQMAKFQKA